ncbi:hypothetical protein L211DRAFT_831259 [Terfezia boudieri ATCC MYA-4762]|uniref:Phosphatidate phosphatase APP1 catalytic domain-containing protein n=1 Tax=Terfezia boudieri ATCC MYA-4762 TaxID=1051890 RepID=A0A3N4L7K1_9PEZI|nr:hypothetical protein L211DRAFT_831259 [Terfezia boudieri ATCC MYA-4762]
MQQGSGQADGVGQGSWEGWRRSIGGYVYSSETGSPDGRGGRRQKLAEYVRAANELRQSYYTPASSITASRGGRRNSYYETNGYEQPSNQELMEYVANGKEEIVLFPSYGRKRIRGQNCNNSLECTQDSLVNIDEAYREEEIVADVDIRGWLYTPHTAFPPSRKNRLVIGMMARLCGLPTIPSPNTSLSASQDSSIGSLTEQETTEALGMHPSSLSFSDRDETQKLHSTMQARLSPFLTTPAFHMPLTVFFYNNTDAQSTTLRTDNLGHFSIRKPLPFFPTHVRVLAGETLCAEEEVRYINPESGISLISDIDDTIKISGIGTGLREMFRNVFTREMSNMPVPGVAGWFNALAASPLHVQVHYLSNSPWQLYPFLKELIVDYMKLPRGTWHLKKYSGFVQGIFEPVTERKKESLESLMRDFPGRKWILVGDGGEGDLEVYTEAVKKWPGKVIAVYIRDVSGIGEKEVRTGIGPNSQKEYSTESIEMPSRIHMHQGNESSLNLKEKSVETLLHSDPQSQLPYEHIPAFNTEATRKKLPPKPPKPKQLRSNSLTPECNNEEKLIDLRGTEVADPIVALYDGSEYGSPPQPQRPPLPRRGTNFSINASRVHHSVLDSDVNTSKASFSSDQFPLPKVLDKKAELWKRRWEYADEVLAEQGVLLRSWRVGQDVQEECVALAKVYLGF